MLLGRVVVVVMVLLEVVLDQVFGIVVAPEYLGLLVYFESLGLDVLAAIRHHTHLCHMHVVGGPEL